MTRDGYITSLTTGEAGGNVDQTVFRGDIVWEPTEKLDFRFNYQADDNTFTEPRVQDAIFRTYDDPNPNWPKQIIGLPEFNSGGVSVATIGQTRTLFPFEPSTLENTEIGIRSDLANGKVRLNATVFSTDWVDLQAAGVVYDPVTGAQIPTLVTTNVGSAQAEGVEVELTFVPTDPLLISLAMGWLDTGYTQIKPGTMTGHLPLTTGTEFQLAPDTSYTVGLQYTASLDNGGSFISRLDYNYQGQFWRSEPFLRVSGYAAVPDGYEESGDWGIANARFVYMPAAGNWEAAFFGTNLTDEYTLNSGFFHGIWGYDFATVGRPREYGASLTFRF